MVPIPRVVYEHHTNTMVWKTHTISHSYQYHVTIPYHVILKVLVGSGLVTIRGCGRRGGLVNVIGVVLILSARCSS